MQRLLLRSLRRCSNNLVSPINTQIHVKRLSSAAARQVEEDDEPVPPSSAFPQIETIDKIIKRETIRNAPISLDMLKSEIVILPTPDANGPRKKTQVTDWRKPGDLVALFEACIATGNHERLANLLDQITKQGDYQASIKSANRYLESLVDEVHKTPSLRPILQHFTDIEKKWLLETDATTYALLCKAALAVQDEETRKTHIASFARSWRLRHKDIGEILAQANILSAQDIGQILDLAKIDYRLIGREFRDRLDIAHPLAAVPEVKATKQKGGGLQFLKYSLQALIDTEAELKVNHADYVRGGDMLAFNLARQKTIEENAIEAALQRWKFEHDDLVKRGGISYKKSLNFLLWEWKEQMVPLIKEELARIEQRIDPKRSVKSSVRTIVAQEPAVRDAEMQEDYEAMQEQLNTSESNRSRKEYGPYLSLLNPDKLAAITILETIRSLSTENTDGMKSAVIVIKIGRALEQEYQSELLKKKDMSELVDIHSCLVYV